MRTDGAASTTSAETPLGWDRLTQVLPSRK